MRTKLRRYKPEEDFSRIGDFLVKTCRSTGGHMNWLQPRWEYMHYHSLIEGVDLDSIGVWEAKGEIVGVAHPVCMATGVAVEAPARGPVSLWPPYGTRCGRKDRHNLYALAVLLSL